MEVIYMAFKKVNDYNEEKFGGLFLLRNDGDSADVVFLYQSIDDVLVADVHYIKSADYSGYVHCCGGHSCPACNKGIRTQTKLFIPMYNINEDEIQFFDRSMRFEPQLQQDVFANYPNPSEFVFRITRHGAAGSVDTTYEIQAVGKNTFKPYAQILAEKGAVMPDYYNTICRDVDQYTLQSMLDSSNKANNSYSPEGEYHYNAVPRGASSTPVSSQPIVATPTAYVPPEGLPGVEPSIDDVPGAEMLSPNEGEANAEDEEILGNPVF